MDEKKSKEGVSVKEIENFAKKHRFEVFICLALLLGCIFGSVIYNAIWMMGSATIGGIIGVLLTSQVEKLCKNVLSFIFKQEMTTQLVLGIVLLVVSIFLSPLIFLLLGLHGGKDIAIAGKTYSK